MSESLSKHAHSGYIVVITASFIKPYDDITRKFVIDCLR